MSVVTPADVLAETKPSKVFLCPLAANVYGIEFLHFVIKNGETRRKIFEATPSNVKEAIANAKKAGIQIQSFSDPDSFRKIAYEFDIELLKAPTIQTDLLFKVGNKEVENFRMIERHYFRNKLIKSYDFKFGFCIPGSSNSWSASYKVPALEDELLQEIVAHPWETVSDTYYFAQDRLIMHNKAYYRYYSEEESLAKQAAENGGRAKTPPRSAPRSPASPSRDRSESKQDGGASPVGRGARSESKSIDSVVDDSQEGMEKAASPGRRPSHK